tara:strand:+ start:722 stop:1360 length:639 start_codon:yes stop_codon:yes gene_type:complete
MFALAAVMVCCCLVVMCLYFRRKKAKEDPAELSPYEKWIANEEAKRTGAPVKMANESGHAKLNIAGRDGARLQKLHTKHGVPMDPPKANISTHNPMNGQASAPRESEAGLADLFRQSENVAGDWGNDEFSGGGGIGMMEGDMGVPGSTHNPMYNDEGVAPGQMAEDGYDDYYESNEGSFYGQQLEDGMDGGDLSAPQERGEGQGSDYNYSQE